MEQQDKSSEESKKDSVKDAELSIENILSTLPENKRAVIISVLEMQMKSFRGPLPPPEYMAEYGRIVPDAPDRILKMAERQLDHRIAYENRMVNSQIWQSAIGQILGFVVAIIFGALVYFITALGYPMVAATVGVTTIIGLAVIFVLNREPNLTGYLRKKEKTDGPAL